MVLELSRLKASQMCKVCTSSNEITNEPYVSSNFENTGKTVTADFTTNYDAETNTSLTEKIKNVREHNFEGIYIEFKGVIHRGNCTKNKLYNDIEKTLFLVCTLWIPGKLESTI